MRILPLFAAMALVVLCALDCDRAFSWPDGTADACVTVFDQAAIPGQSANLMARLEHTGMLGIHPNMVGYELRFRCGLFVDQRTVTATNGLASTEVEIPAHAVNFSSVEVCFAGSPHHTQAVGAGRLFLWPKDSPILITDVDHTISDLALVKVPFTSNEQIPPLPGAVAALKELAQPQRIVYLSARDTSLYGKTRAWLQEKGFPEGPLFCREFNIAVSQESFKRHFIAEFKKRYPQTVVGVGDQPGDGRAYLDNGMKAFIVDPTGKTSLPPGCLRVESWRDVVDQLGERRGVNPP